MNEILEVESAAKKKRRPFVVKSSEGSHNVYCLQHATEIATFYCAVCHKPHCEDCVAGERGDQTLCSSCVESKVQNDIQKDDRKHRRRSLLWWSVGGLTAVAVLTNFFFIMSYAPSSEVVDEPEVSSQVSSLVECRHRLEGLAEHARTFHQSMQKPPTSMEDVAVLVEDSNMLLEPITSQPYVLDTEDGKIKIVCPNPKAHGVAALFAEPKKPAKMVLLK